MTTYHCILPDRIGRAAAAAIAPQLCALIEGGTAPHIDAAAAECIGVVGWQLLLSAGQTAEAAGLRLHVAKPSAAMMASAAEAGLTDWLERHA